MCDGKKLIIGLIMMSLCANFGQQESDVAKEKPRINFRGLLRDSTGQEFAVENITIGGLYKDIPVYAKPASPSIEPATNTTLLDLSEIDEIRPTFEHPEQKLVDYQNRRYVEITVILKNEKRTTMNFIIELSRKIMCDIKTDGGDVEKRLSFEALQNLKIQDYIKREEPKNKTQEKKRDKNREYQCREAGKALKKLEEVSDNVSGEQKSKLTELIESLKNWIGGICGTQE